jgi:hypothetical protein
MKGGRILAAAGGRSAAGGHHSKNRGTAYNPLMKRAVITSFLFLASVGVFQAQTQPAKPDGYPAIGQPTIVTMLSPGAAPRVPLRYTIARDYKAHMEMNTTMSMSMDIAGMQAPSMQIPSMKMGADVGVTGVTPSGDVSFAIAFTGVSVDNAPGVDPTIAATIQSMEGDLKTVHGSATMTNRGATRGATVDISKVTNPQLAQMMGSLSSSLDGLTVPLPEEAVGVGARWESRQAIQSGGMQIYQKTLWELVAIDRKTVSLKAVVEQMAPPQPINNPMLPAGADVSLERLTGSGNGTVSLHLDGLVPTSDVNMQTTVVMNVNAGGSTQQMTIATTMKMGISPGKS